MIKFFRRIRQNVLMENKPSSAKASAGTKTGLPAETSVKAGKYFKYAIGEITLVVIGILIALQINNWNESNNSSKKEVALLVNLKNDINADILDLTQQDSMYSKLGDEAAIGINLFYKAKNIKHIDSVSKLTTLLWNDLYINKNTYNEMISSGSMYRIKNENLKKNIIKHYLNVEAYKYYIREVSKEQSHLYVKTPEMNSYKFLLSQLKNPQADFTTIDTTWINNPKSPTYLALITYLNRNKDYNIDYRRRVYKKNIIASEELLAKINEELENRK